MDIIAPVKKRVKFYTKCFLSLEYEYEKKVIQSFTNLFGKKTINYHYMLISVGGLINAREPSLLAGFNLV